MNMKRSSIAFLVCLGAALGIASRPPRSNRPVQPGELANQRWTPQSRSLCRHGRRLTPPGASWIEGLTILNDGDQLTADFTIGGHTGKKATGNYLNTADMDYAEWADEEFH